MVPSDDDNLMLEVYQGNFEHGDQMSLILALKHCLKRSQPVPEWAATALLAAIGQVQNYEATSWDEVFGVPHPGRKVDQLRIERRLRWEVLHRVTKYRRQKPKPKDIFRVVAEELNISPATCKRYFDNLHRWFRKSPS